MRLLPVYLQLHSCFRCQITHFSLIKYVYGAKIPLQKQPGKDVKRLRKDHKSVRVCWALRDILVFQGLKNRNGCVSIQWGQGEKDFPLVSARAAPDRPALCVLPLPLVSCGICSLCVSREPSESAKSLIKPQRAKVSAFADRLCDTAHLRKGQRVTAF